MQAYAHAMQRANKKDDARRMVAQTALTEVLMQAFHADAAQVGGAAAHGALPSPETLYEACTTFTRNYLHAFMPDRQVPDARFARYDEMSSDTYSTNPIVRASCEHLAGMIYYDEGGEREYEDVLEPLKALRYAAVLCRYGAVHRGRASTARHVVEQLD
jgi:hypothetical protein